MNSEKGVTLIILVITITVLLILSRIVINSAVSDDGIVSETIEAKKESFDDNIRDSLLALQLNYTSKKEYIDFLKANKYIDDKNVINVKTLLAVTDMADVDFGKGSGMKEVYVLTDDLDLIYYYEDGVQEKIENIGTSMQP